MYAMSLLLHIWDNCMPLLNQQLLRININVILSNRQCTILFFVAYPTLQGKCGEKG